MRVFNKVKILKESDIEEVCRFYANAGRYVKYFQDMFGKTDCTEDIYRNFSPDVAAAIRMGYCLGFFDSNVLVGCILLIDWNLYAQEHPTLMDHMFLPELQTTKDINKVISGLEGPTCFAFAIVVEETSRCLGYGTELVKRITKMLHSQCNIVSDCIYPNANAIWLRNGYHIDQISEELQLAIKEM